MDDFLCELRWKRRDYFDEGGAIPRGKKDYLIKVGAIRRGKKIVEDNWWNLSQGGDSWEIVSNSNCDLESQLGFLVEEGKINLGYLIIEGKAIP